MTSRSAAILAFALTSSIAAPIAQATPTSEPWCVEGLLPLDASTCYLLPEGADRLVVYLHGIIPPHGPSPQKDNLERAVFRAAQRGHFAVLFPRGVTGIGPGAQRDYWAWPTRASDYAVHAASMTAAWSQAKANLETLAGRPFAKTFYAGSSNGAYFLCSLIFRGALVADGYAALSGGSAGVWSAPRIAAIGPRPFFVAYGSEDPTNGDPRSLVALLRAAHWPSRNRELPGGHGAREVYLDEAIAYWASVSTP